MVTKLLSLLPALTLTVAAAAQISPTAPPLDGTHLALTRNGNPPIAGSTTTIMIVPTAVPGVLVGGVFTDNGSGPQPVPGEAMVIVGSGGLYSWQNERCTMGRFVWVGGDEWFSEVLTGPNTGVVRRMVPML